MRTGKEQATLPGHLGVVSSVAFAPDGRTLVSADSKGTVKLWDVAGTKERITIPNPDHTFFLQSLVVTSDGKTVVATLMGQDGQNLKEWDVASGKERATYRGTPDNGFPLGFSGDGSVVLLGKGTPVEGTVALGKGTMELWELRSLNTEPPKQTDEPAGAKPPASAGGPKEPGWPADASRTAIPDRPAAGRLHGRPFVVERARVAPNSQTSGNADDPPEKQNRADGSVITLQQGKDHVPSNYYTIFLAVKPGDTVDGKTFVVPAGGIFKQTEKVMDKDGKGWFFPVGGVQANSREPGGKPRADVMPKVSMRLELGKRKDGRLPGKIYLCIDDQEKSFVAGSFEAEVEAEDKK
jgi:hypothetical protein